LHLTRARVRRALLLLNEEPALVPRTVLVLNGPNLNLLGTREPEIYGRETLDEIMERVVARGAELGLGVEARQTNHEGVLVDWLHEARSRGVHAVLLNAGAYTHTSIALLDEPFRHLSYVGMGAVRCVKGLGAQSYIVAIEAAAAL
jgi:3-dehydroquinate dehydratase-2